MTEQELWVSIWFIQFQLVKSLKVQELRDKDRPESSSLELVLRIALD